MEKLYRVDRLAYFYFLWMIPIATLMLPNISIWLSSLLGALGIILIGSPVLAFLMGYLKNHSISYSIPKRRFWLCVAFTFLLGVGYSYLIKLWGINAWSLVTCVILFIIFFYLSVLWATKSLTLIVSDGKK